MPIFRADEKLVYYAHVPKCGGSAVGWYLEERFGTPAFADRNHTSQPTALRWSRTSPQHIDTVSLSRLFPENFFDASFTIVRHPVARIVSAFHFQKEVERLVPETTSFSEWLLDIMEMREADPFVHDNHVRPMSEIVPAGAEVFYMEHGIDALVPWFDLLTGQKTGPRAIPRVNDRGAYTSVKTERVKPEPQDLALIAEIYAADFARFGYRVEDKMPRAAAPEISEETMAERDAALKAMNNPMSRLTRKIAAKIGL